MEGIKLVVMENGIASKLAIDENIFGIFGRSQIRSKKNMRTKSSALGSRQDFPRR